MVTKKARAHSARASWLNVKAERLTCDNTRPLAVQIVPVRILSPQTVAEALRPGYGEGYGLHWELFPGSPGGAEPPTFGHGGSDGTMAVAYPHEDAMILFFTQSREARDPWREAMQRLPSLVGVEGPIR